MAPGIVRIGGIAVLLPIVAGIVGGVVYLAAQGAMEAATDPAIRERKYVETIEIREWIIQLGQFLVLAATAVVYRATWGLFGALGDRAAKAPAMAMWIFAAVLAVISLILWIGVDKFGQAMLSLMLLIFVYPLLIPLTIWFAITAIRFGRNADLPLWKAVGIVYLAGMTPAVAGYLLLVSGNKGWLYTLCWAVAGSVLLGGWICHGIALIRGARTMAHARA